MNKELRELLEKINNKKEEAKKLIADNKISDAKKVRDEIVNLQEQFDVMKDLYDDERNNIENGVNNGTATPVASPKKDNKVKQFLDGLRTKFANGFKEGAGEDGGFTVPEEISTDVEEYRVSKNSLEKLITVTPVKKPAGARTFKKRAQQTGFVEVDEGGEIPEKLTPKFSRLKYAVKKYAGFFSVTNEVLSDTDANLRKILVKWIGDESRVTRNKLILAVLKTKAKTAITGLDNIKHAVNVLLDPAFQPTSVVVTNQDGFNWLDTQKDTDGKYILQPNPTDKTKHLLFGRYPISVISNSDLPSVSNKAPLIIGDLKEAVVMFDRKKLSIKASDVAGTAFLTDMTLFRAIEREEVKMRDEAAFVYGEIALS